MPRVIVLDDDQEAGRALSRLGHEVLCSRDLPEAVRACADALDFHQRLLSASGLIIAAYTADGACVFVNDALLRVVGGTREIHLAGSFRKLDSWRRGGLLAMADRTLATGEETRQEAQFVTTFGRDVWLECHFARFTSGGRPHLLATARDITDQRRVEAALRESEEKYRKVAEMAGDAIFLADAATGVLIEVNRSGEELLGLPADRIVGMHQSRLHPPDSEEEVRRIFLDHVAKGGCFPTEVPVLGPGGRRVPTEVNSRVFELGGRKVVLGIFRDLSERKKAEEERRGLEARIRKAHQLESLGMLAGGIAHDFNNLLMSILGNGELILHDLPEGSLDRECMEDALAAARRASDLCREMLAYAGKSRFVVGDIELRPLVEEIVRVLRVSTPKQVTVSLDRGESISLRGDPIQIGQVVLNLIKNAIEAIGESAGEVRISTGSGPWDRQALSRTYVDDGLPEGLYAHLDVSDTGCGMDEEAQRYAFEPFHSTKAVGRGLGMAVVLGIVRAHGGAIQIDSEPGRGTRIRVLLPLAR